MKLVERRYISVVSKISQVMLSQGWTGQPFFYCEFFSSYGEKIFFANGDSSKIVFVHWVLCQSYSASAPRFWASTRGEAELGWVGWGAAFFLHRECPNRAGVHPWFMLFTCPSGKKENWSVHSCLKTSILLDHPWLTGLSSEHRHQTLSQFPPLGALTFACICSFLSLDLRGFCRIPSICRKGAKRAHGQGDETDWKDAKAEMWPSSGPGVSTVPLVIWIKRRFYAAGALISGSINYPCTCPYIPQN